MSSKGSILKTLAGCGCALLLVGVLLGGAGLYAAWVGVQKLSAVAAEKSKSFDPQRLKDLRELLPEDVEMPEVDQKRIVQALGRPLDAEDVDRFLAANKWFYDQPENSEASKALKEASQGTGLDVFTNGREAMEKHTKLIGLLTRFNTYISENDGYVKQIDGAIRCAGVAAAADAFSKVKGGEPWDAKSAAELKALASKTETDVELDPLAKQMGLAPTDLEWARPGLVALSKMPNESFETWEKLPVAKRKELIETYRKQGSAVLATQLNPVLQTGGLLEILAQGFKNSGG